MECQACHTANHEKNRFCENCGSELAVKCSACGFNCAGTAKFCGGCGASLRPVGLPAASSTVDASVWGELKQATVLFADIVSSTEQIASLGPEEAMDRLQPAIVAMCAAVERFGGTVVRTLGDGVMALFGAPKALEGHARLACEAAVHMQKAFASDLPGMQIRVGLHSGLVASDPRAFDGSKGGGAHGLTIHLASRVVGLAAPGAVALTGDCYSLIRSSVDATSMGYPALRGIPEPIEVFELTGLKVSPPRHHFHQAALTPFLGRDREMTLLQEAQRLAQSGTAQLIGISGAAGAGKSRLCYEFAQWCRGNEIPVFEVQAQLYGHATPLQPALELLRGFFFRVAADASAPSARSAITDRLALLAGSTDSDLALVCEFLGVAESAAPGPQLNPKARRTRLLHIVRELFKDTGKTHSILIIEDLHWIDEGSEEFISTLIHAVAGTRVLLVLNYRSSYISPWIHHPDFRQLDLAELNAEDMNAMVRELISHRRELSAIYQLIVKRSGGNPFFAEEIVRSLAETGALRGELSRDDVELESIDRGLPSTVQAVVGARIDRLEDAEKMLLQMCAIIGKEIPFAVLAQVASSMSGELEALLERLCDLELLQPQSAAGGRRFSFRHPLIQEVAYGTQLKSRRAAIHGSVANAMEAHFRDRLDEYAALVAYHHEAAGDQLRAAHYESRAAQWVGATDSARAIKHWQRVRGLLQDKPRTIDSDRLRAMACSKVVLLGWREGLSLKEVSAYLQEAMNLASEVDSRLTQLLLFLDGRLLQANGGSADKYVEQVTKALALASGAGDAGRRATLNAALSQAYSWAGLLEKGLAANDAALSGIDCVDQFDQEFLGFSIEEWLYGIRVRLLIRLDRLDEAEFFLQRMLDAQNSSTDPVLRQIVHYGYVDLAARRGDAEIALRHATSAKSIAGQHGAPYLRMVALFCAGVAEYISGRFEDAAISFSDALTLVRAANVAIEFETEILASLAECHRGAGNFRAAHIVAQEAISMSRKRSHRLLECRALISLGAVLAQEFGHPSQAAEVLDQAEHLVRLTGARIYEASLQRERIMAASAGIQSGLDSYQ